MHTDKKETENAISTSTSYREAAGKLGCHHQMMAKLATEYGISTDHFDFGHAYDQMVGNKYGMLTVCEIRKRLPIKGKRNRGRRYAYCLCDCGNHKEVRADGLKAGRYISCGCHSHNRWNTVAGKNHAFAGEGEIRASYFQQMKRSAEKRNIDFALTIEEAWDLYQRQNNKCALTGLPISFGRVHYPNETNASPDRIDSNQGYYADNLQWVLKDINLMKRCFNNEYFIRLCNLVAQQHPRDLKGCGYISD